MNRNAKNILTSICLWKSGMGDELKAWLWGETQCWDTVTSSDENKNILQSDTVSTCKTLKKRVSQLMMTTDKNTLAASMYL